ncbi:MAG: hypothetical protein GX104_04300 [Spirochaetales bacterium]|nr:hypothetical protein [Spirochaetales bacterium]
MFNGKGEKTLYTLEFDHIRFCERIVDGSQLASFSVIEGIDYDYLRYKILKSRQKPSLLHRLRTRMKDYFIQLYVTTFRPTTIQKTNNGEHIM